MSFKGKQRDIWYLRVSVSSLSWLNTSTTCLYWWHYLCDLFNRLTALNIYKHEALFWELWWGGKWCTWVCRVFRIHFCVAASSKFAGTKLLTILIISSKKAGKLKPSFTYLQTSIMLFKQMWLRVTHHEFSGILL